jgi:hypothetical protein
MHRITSTAFGIFMPLFLGAFTSEALASGSRSATPCATAAQAMLKSCQAGAMDDDWLATAICANLSSRREMSECTMQAFEDRMDAQDECADQYQARREVCDRLGGGAYQPDLDPADFVSGVTNPFFPLVPGTTFIYEQRTAGGVEHIEVHVTREIKEILGIPCTVVRDTATLDGEVIEDTLDWYAQDVRGNVWYLGEESRSYEDGDLISIDGSWKAGRDGALPGIIMEAHPQARDLYRQEYLPGDAEDLAAVASLNKSVTVAYGTFNHCLMTEDFSPLDPGVVEYKFYAEGIGNVLELDADGSRLELIAITHN